MTKLQPCVCLNGMNKPNYQLDRRTDSIFSRVSTFMFKQLSWVSICVRDFNDKILRIRSNCCASIIIKSNPSSNWSYQLSHLISSHQTPCHTLACCKFIYLETDWLSNLYDGRLIHPGARLMRMMFDVNDDQVNNPW